MATEQALAWFLEDPGATLGIFLRVQWIAYTMLHRSLSRPFAPEVNDMVLELLAALRKDGAAGGPPICSGYSLDPRAAAYVAVGARLGTAVLRRRCAESGIDPLPAYFAPRNDVACWRGVCAELDTIPPQGEIACHIIEDAQMAFRMFQTAAADVRRGAVAHA